MASRSIQYSEEQLRSFDLLWSYKDYMNGICRAAQAVLGVTTPLLFGFSASQQSVPNLSIQLAEGQIYQWAAVDAQPFGALAADSTNIYQQGHAAANTNLPLTTANMTAGQQQYALVQCQLQQVDSVRTGDPTSGILPYWNSSNPLLPLQGEGGNGEEQPTVRTGAAVVEVIYGTAAATGTAVPPSPTTGWTPMYLILLSQNQTAITQGQILTAGPAAYSGYQQAPFCPGLVGQLPNSSGSHHGGIAGQAAKVLLTNGAEVQGTMSFANLPVTNQSPLGIGGSITLAGVIPVHYQGTGSPNGSVAGNKGDSYFDTAGSNYWECTTTGISSAAVWKESGGGATALYVNTSPIAVQSNTTYIVDTTGGNITLNLGTAASAGGLPAAAINIGPNNMVLTPQSGEALNYGSNGASNTYTKGQGFTLWPRGSVGWYSESAKYNAPQNVRLYTVTGTPNNTSDQTGITSVYIGPFNGNTLTLKNSGGVWTPQIFSEVTLAVPATTSTMYSAFVSSSSNIAVTPVAVAWTNATTPGPAALALDNGNWVLESDHTKLFVGSFQTTTVSGETNDSAISRLVQSYFNRLPVQLSCSIPTSTWTYGTATWRPSDANTTIGQGRVELISCLGDETFDAAFEQIGQTSGSNCDSGIGLDSATSPNVLAVVAQSGSGINTTGFMRFLAAPAAGYHYLQELEIQAPGGTATFSGTTNNVMTVAWRR